MPRDVITAVIVTYNRKALLARCLTAVANQTRKPQRILIVDNASTDGTREFLQCEGWLSRTDVRLLPLSANSGGAGGFSAGLRHAVDQGAEWVWMMDDDACPEPDALEALCQHDMDPRNVYSSLAVSDTAPETPAWPLTPLAPQGAPLPPSTDGLPEMLELAHTPFLGILISATVANAIGLPDEGYFLGRDDVEYCLRARNHGARVFLVSRSRIRHPQARMFNLRFPGITVRDYILPPWKRYYVVRNRLFLARTYPRFYGRWAFPRTIVTTIARLPWIIAVGPRRLLQAKAVLAGIFDALANRRGKRHPRWNLQA